MSAHTPGPWNVSWSLTGKWLVRLHNRTDQSPHEFTLPRDREADARLVAAAPELVAALELMEEVGGEVIAKTSACSFPDLDAALEKVRDLLFRINGRPQ